MPNGTTIIGERRFQRAKMNVGFAREGKQEKLAGENPKGNFGKYQHT